MDKMLVDSIGDVVITNDGATILKEMDIEHPAAKMVVEVAKAQDDESATGPQPQLCSLVNFCEKQRSFE